MSKSKSWPLLSAGAVLAISVAAAPVAFAASASVSVVGEANPNLAGQPAGVPCCGGDSSPGQDPLLVPLSVSGGDVFTFSATGLTDGAGTGLTGPDGAYIFNMTDYGLGIAPALDVGVLGLVGVFLDSSTPTGGTEPAPLNFSGGLNFASLAPGLAQIFWIGDGLTGTGSGSVQTFTAPSGATRLYLGTIDGFQWNNNTGAYAVTVNSSAPGVPEPAAWTMMLLGVAGVGASIRSRRRTSAGVV